MTSLHSREQQDIHQLESSKIPFWILFLVALPSMLVPLYFVYIPPGYLSNPDYSIFIINDYQKYVAELVSFGILFGLGGTFAIWKNAWGKLPHTLLWPALLYAAAIAISLFQSIDMARGFIVGLETYLLPALFFLLVASIRWSFTQCLTILGFALFSGTIVALIGISELMQLIDLPSDFPELGTGSLLANQNFAGEYIAILIPVAVAITLAPLHRVIRFSAAAASFAFMIHLVLTTARGAWVAYLGGIVVTSILGLLSIRHELNKKKDIHFTEKSIIAISTFWPLPCLIPLFLLIIFSTPLWTENTVHNPSQQSYYVQELSNIDLAHTNHRFDLWTDALDMLKQHWLWGVGPGHFKVHSLAFCDNASDLVIWSKAEGRYGYPNHPHNDYLENWLELGLLGLIGTIWLFASISWIATKGIGKAVVSGDLQRALIIWGAFSGFVILTISMLFEFPFRMPASLTLGWLCAAFAVSFSRSQRAPLQTRQHTKIAASIGMAALLTICLWLAHNHFWSDIFMFRSAALKSKGQLTQSYDLQKKALFYAPWKEQSLLEKARISIILGNYEGALASAKENLKRNPYSLPAIYIKGVTSLALGRPEEGRSSFQRIVDEFPYLPEIKRYRKLAGKPSTSEP